MSSRPSAYRATRTYAIAEKIAEGGMATVFGATALGEHGLERPCALKRIHERIARDPQLRSRFIEEALLQASLCHPNVVAVLDVGEADGDLYLAMEYVNGPTLALAVNLTGARHSQIPLPVAGFIAVELLRGLEAIHRAGIVHGDVSPSNVLLSRAGEVKIADFGVASALARPTVSAVRRRLFCNTAYAAPEQARGGRATLRSDLFSACVVMFECLTGKPLFSAHPPRLIREAMESMPIPRADSLRPEIPGSVADLLARGLERDPAARPSSASELLKELVAALKLRGMTATAFDLERFLTYLGTTPSDEPLRELTRELSGIVEQAPTLVHGNAAPSTQRPRPSWFGVLSLLSWILYELVLNFGPTGTP